MSRFRRILIMSCGVVLLVAGTWAVAAAAAVNILRPATPGMTALEWNGIPPQMIHAATGASIQGVVEQRDGPTVDKRISGVRYENLELQVGAGLDRKFYEWIHSNWTGKAEPMSGAVLACGSMGQCLRKEFANAALSEVTVPTLDGASKERCWLGISLRPGLVRLPKNVTAATPPKAEQSVWLASNFRLAVDGLDCTQVRKIDSFTIKQGATTEFPDLEITLGSKGYETWRSWFEEFVVKAASQEERNGEITFYSADLQTVLGRIRLTHLGITALDLVPGGSSSTAAAGGETIAGVKAKLYCERMELLWGAGPVAPVSLK